MRGRRKKRKVSEDNDDNKSVIKRTCRAEGGEDYVNRSGGLCSDITTDFLQDTIVVNIICPDFPLYQSFH